MKTREKQNKHKLKFAYIASLQMLGKIWKEHSKLVNSSISKTDNSYIDEVIKLMSVSKKKEYSSILERCNDIAANINKIDDSLKKSHKDFSKYKKLMSESND